MAQPVSPSLYQDVFQHLEAITRPTGLRRTAVTRLALLVVGIIAAQSCVLTRVAAELDALGLTRASSPASIARRLRRTLSDGRLLPERCYGPAVQAAIDWAALRRGGQPLVLAADESSQDQRVHLFRVSVCYWGTSLPLAWTLWPQQVALQAGQYWAALEAVLQSAAALIPRGVPVVLTADRAYDIPPWIDRVAALGWHWVVRLKARGSLRFRDRQGQEHALAQLLALRLPGPGSRVKMRGWVFKKAGWRPVSLVGSWAPGQPEPLVLLSDLPPRWELLARYDRRFWIECGFRSDKSLGWQWERSQVSDLEHQRRLVLALAWASLVALLLGRQQAERLLGRQQAERLLAQVGTRCRPRQPEHARASLLTLGLQQARRWLYRALEHPLRWVLDQLEAPAWNDRWLAQQRHAFIFSTVRP